ncbi:MAG: hypothetical protein PHY34_03670 [Patescibacteria group bacterium]|nr:hypothetical protein [Patescibacteria group bacterium]MDD5716010.1 hypothetical protein [Patescibacteria group bacterium]
MKRVWVSLIRWFEERLRRYRNQIVASVLGALIGGNIVIQYTDNRIVIDEVISWSDLIAFYICAITMALCYHWKHERYKPDNGKYLRTIFKAIRDISEEYLGIEIIDTLFLRPALVDLGIHWISGFNTGIIFGVLVSDLSMFLGAPYMKKFFVWLRTDFVKRVIRRFRRSEY